MERIKTKCIRRTIVISIFSVVPSHWMHSVSATLAFAFAIHDASTHTSREKITKKLSLLDNLFAFYHLQVRERNGDAMNMFVGFVRWKSSIYAKPMDTLTRVWILRRWWIENTCNGSASKLNSCTVDNENDVCTQRRSASRPTQKLCKISVHIGSYSKASGRINCAMQI